MIMDTPQPSGKMSGTRFGILCIAAYLGTIIFYLSVFLALLSPFLLILPLLYFGGAFVLGMWSFLKVRKPSPAPRTVDIFVFTTSALFSLIGSVIAYLLLKDKQLM